MKKKILSAVNAAIAYGLMIIGSLLITSGTLDQAQYSLTICIVAVAFNLWQFFCRIWLALPPLSSFWMYASVVPVALCTIVYVLDWGPIWLVWMAAVFSILPFAVLEYQIIAKNSPESDTPLPFQSGE